MKLMLSTISKWFLTVIANQWTKTPGVIIQLKDLYEYSQTAVLVSDSKPFTFINVLFAWNCMQQTGTSGRKLKVWLLKWKLLILRYKLRFMQLASRHWLITMFYVKYSHKNLMQISVNSRTYFWMLCFHEHVRQSTIQGGNERRNHIGGICTKFICMIVAVLKSIWSVQ